MDYSQNSVSKILSEQHGITNVPGQKVECPFCHHKTFSIKRDDSLGKCFHPGCERFITPYVQKNNKFYKVFENLFYDWHSTLLELENGWGNNAYTYLVKERKIHPQVVVDSMLGAVPPSYDVEAKFAPLIDEMKAEIETEKHTSKSKGRPKKSEVVTSNEIDIVEVRDKLIKCINGHTGWLCFFYTDEFHHIVSIRFREPYSKHIVYFKPFLKAGLFGHGLFTPYESEVLKELNERLIVTEGEFNQLQLQSLCIRTAESKDTNASYVFACSVGGVHNTDYNTIQAISKHPVFCYDNDESGAGFKLVDKALNTMSVYAFTTPATDSDLDKHILSFGSNYRTAWNSVKSLINKRQFYPINIKSVAKNINSMREDGYKEFQIHQDVAEIVINDLHERGKFYNDSLCPYVFLNSDKKLIMIQPDNIEFQLLLNRYGLNRTERIYNYVLEQLRVEAFEKGIKTEVYKLAFYNSETFTLYLYNFKNQIYRISSDYIELLDNGTDGVLFLSDSKYKPFEITEGNNTDSLLAKVIIDKINFAYDLLSPDEKRFIFTLWLLSIFFESIMPTKPIVAFIGEKGSGKTITLRKVGMLLFGPDFNVTPLPVEEKDFDAAVTNSYYVAIDNADKKCKWLDDKLATMATGGTIKRRDLYTTNNLVEYKTKCFLGITSRTPYFRRDDVAERLLIMKVEKLKSKNAENKLLNEVNKNRDEIMTEIVNYLQEIVRALKKENETDYSGNFRMADFADFALKVACYGCVEIHVRNVLDKLSNEQSYFALEDNPTFDLLYEWAPNNPGKEVTNAELCKELADLADKKRIDFPYKGKTQSFAQHMRNLRANLSEIFDITERTVGARKNLYKYTLKLEDK